ncbi:hypothetical protein AN963_25970 [Brevibacillus choshinensis]|uniref:Uncharacterized protein n=1 Tax=Brevibacillus choshinensis TaxID=54911 RepID=A0ABR5N2T4_BRECH|nr:hypothetical protein [Brevibacillus choshinensis]KQL44809.1 hypothetical protein AN963_25970 [Brevibacillus choshinensis]
MSKEKYDGIKEALEYAEYTGQSVNVGLFRGGEGVKIEGFIEKLFDYSFRIRLETGELDRVKYSEVEYVEYS